MGVKFSSDHSSYLVSKMSLSLILLSSKLSSNKFHLMQDATHQRSWKPSNGDMANQAATFFGSEPSLGVKPENGIGLKTTLMEFWGA